MNISRDGGCTECLGSQFQGEISFIILMVREVFLVSTWHFFSPTFCSVVLKKSLNSTLAFSMKSGKAQVACHCHRLAIGLLFFLVVVLVVMFGFFFPPSFLLEALRKVSQEVSHILGQCPTPAFKLSHGRSYISKRQPVLQFAAGFDLSLIKMRSRSFLSSNTGRLIMSLLLVKVSL